MKVCKTFQNIRTPFNKGTPSSLVDSCKGVGMIAELHRPIGRFYFYTRLDDKKYTLEAAVERALLASEIER